MTTPKQTDQQQRQKVTAHWLDNLLDTHLACRDLGHGWTRNTDYWWKDPYWVRTLYCHRCHTEKHQLFDADTDDLIKSRINKYPKGYQKPNDGVRGRLLRTQIRLQMRTRNRPQQTPIPDELHRLLINYTHLRNDQTQ